jgi:hypothetical protein
MPAVKLTQRAADQRARNPPDVDADIIDVEGPATARVFAAV